MLLDYLENTHGQIYRCRLKKSSTPPETYPEFNADLDQIKIVTDYGKVEPHAFVHFVDPNSVTSVLEAAGRKELVLDKHVLKVSLGPENPYRMNQRRRKKTSFKLSNVVLEIGLMTSRDNFVVGWRGPDSGVDFLIDPFDRSCKFLLTKDTAFCFKGSKDHTIIRCNYKVEFLVRDTDYSESFLVLVFQLASSPLISYRTADDDIINTYPFEMLDDDDPWIRTTDFTPSGAIGRCNTYRVMIRIRDGSKVKKALEFLKEQRVHVEHRKTKLKAENEPEFGFPIPDPFFSIHYKPDISFKVMFLVNSVLHRCIINQHQFTENVFDLLRDQSEEVNVAALKHICAYRHPLYDGFKRLITVQEWLLNTPKRIEKPLEQNDLNYRQVSDRFLRVTFMDEGMRTLNNNVLNFYPAPIVKDVTSTFMAQKTTMFRRVKDILSNGFHLSGRQYCFCKPTSGSVRMVFC
ncbi:putative RNA-directed RNA polymerase [Helianthus annuus]|nr:putative RNA-directed RNA polymerase [Helianthus annuus]